MAHLSKGDELAEDKPEVNHLGIGGEGQLLHHTCEDCRHHQHVGQVHCESRLKEEGLDKSCSKCDEH